jgi:hypothetical protein
MLEFTLFFVPISFWMFLPLLPYCGHCDGAIFWALDSSMRRGAQPMDAQEEYDCDLHKKALTKGSKRRESVEAS